MPGRYESIVCAYALREAGAPALDGIRRDGSADSAMRRCLTHRMN